MFLTPASRAQRVRIPEKKFFVTKSFPASTFDFIGFPAGVTRITVSFYDISLSGTDNILIQIGTNAGMETTGYTSVSRELSVGSGATGTSGFIIFANTSSLHGFGTAIISSLGGYTWTEIHSLADPTGLLNVGSGGKILGGVLDRLTVSRTGTNTYDGGSVNVMYE